MRNFLIPAAIAMLGFTPALAQEAPVDPQVDVVKTQDDLAIEQLLNQYATITLGVHINKRCNQLYPKATDLFVANHGILDGLMKDMMDPKGYQLLNDGVTEAGADEVANPCGAATFDFVQVTAQLASTMAHNVQVFLGKIEPEPETVKAVPATTVQPVVTTAEPEKQDVAPIEETPPPVTTPAPKPEPTVQQSANQVELIPVTSIAGAGETKKQMEKRQRDEVLQLRRAQREEVNSLKDNLSSYTDPKTARKALDKKHDEEQDALRKLHFDQDQAWRE